MRMHRVDHAAQAQAVYKNKQQTAAKYHIYNLFSHSN